MKRFTTLVLLFTCALLASPASSQAAEAAENTEVYSVKDLDTRPKQIKNAVPRYPRELRGTAGEAVLRFTVDPKGKTRDIELLSTTHEAFGVAAIDCVKQWRFKPGIKNGKPVSCRFQMPIVFQPHPSERR